MPSYHFFDSVVSVPSSCISPTILSTAAAKRLVGSPGELLSIADGERLVEHRVADDLHRLAGVDVALGGRERRDHRVEPGAVTEREVLQRVVSVS